jgi:MFS superfamily sulfate permease-like transporter
MLCCLLLDIIHTDIEFIYVFDHCIWCGVITDSSFVPPIIYVILGSSKDLAVGTVAVVSLILASKIGSEVSPEENPHLYMRLVFTATFFAGVFQASLGVLRYSFMVTTSCNLNSFIIE